MESQKHYEIIKADGKESQVEVKFYVKGDRKETYEVDLTATVILGKSTTDYTEVKEITNIVCDIWSTDGKEMHRSATSITDKFLEEEVYQHCI